MAQVSSSAVAAAAKTSYIGTPDQSLFSHESIDLSCLACSAQLGQQQQQLNKIKEMYYSNILCEECKMGMSSKDRQVEIFGLLINFFEPNRPEKQQQKSNDASSKMKIKDLIRLVMHILNEVSGLSSALYSQFPSLIHSNATKKTFLPFHSQQNNHYEQHSEITCDNTFIGIGEKSKQVGSSHPSKNQIINSSFEEITYCSQNIDSNKAPLKEKQTGLDTLENKSLLTRRTNLNGPMLIQPLNQSIQDKHFKNISERRVRTESDEIDEQKHSSQRIASQIRRNSVKTKSLLSTQPQLKRTTILETNITQCKKLPVYAPTLFEEVNHFFTHPSPSAKLNQSKNSNSILASTQYATGASDFLAQTSQIDIQLDGSFNNEEFSKTVPNPLKEFTDRLLSFPSDTQEEIEIYPRKSSLTQMTKKHSDPFNQTGIIQIQKKRNSFVPLVPPSKTSMYPIQDSIKNEGIQKMAAGLLKRDPSKGIPARSSSPNPLPISSSQKIEPLRSSSCSRNMIDQKYNTSFRQFHPRSKSSLTAATQSEFLPSSLIQSRTGSTGFQQTATQKENPLQIQIYSQSSVRVTKAQERSIIKALMREQYGEQYNEGVHKQDQGEINEPKYMIAADWWRNWLEFVDFYQANNEIELNNRPGIISNIKLLKPRQINDSNAAPNLLLKDDLLEHYDYEAVPKSVYDHLSSWYSCDFQIVRFLKSDPSRPANQQTFLELYPEKSQYLLLPSGIQRKRKAGIQLNSEQQKELNNKQKYIDIEKGTTNSQNIKDNSKQQKSNSVISHAEESSSYCHIF